ncbi:zinc finger BED domain-containing protein 4-like [Parasteatoda tepidariorum]|uniref:zinc finger BED domain-containing protein 4-like n=1 Tax=Parasteatoda tepidariorum TaxID=114398 RepID=UPI000A2C0776|nr:zinc finger BED domain-containing protein 4-like [Parasteatoda tepidariorum]
MNRKSSQAWNFFTRLDRESKLAKCKLCGTKLSYKSSVTNLSKHILRKHPSINLSRREERNIPPVSTATCAAGSSHSNDEPDISPIIDEPDEPAVIVQPSSSLHQPSSSLRQPSSSLHQHLIQEFLSKKVTISDKKKIDEAFIKLFTQDFQPFSIVEDEGFKSFVKALNPNYNLPNRKTISGTWLPAKFEECSYIIHEKMKDVDSMCLTIDSWTSRNNESYLAVTGHFIDIDFDLKTVLLGCKKYDDSHTASHLAMRIKDLTDAFNVSNKILVCVTDNATNMKNAVTVELKLKHFPCLAHTLNLIVRDALKLLHELIEKIKSVVAFFKRSTTCNEKLLNYQKNNGIEQPKKLIQDVVTRWNSTFYMLERYVLLKDAIKTTIVLINKDLPILSENEWLICEEVVEVLRPFEEITRELSGEKYVTASKIPVIVKGLISVCNKLSMKSIQPITQDILKHLNTGLTSRLGRVQLNETVTICSILDPRYKTLALETTSAEFMKKRLIEFVASEVKKKMLSQEINMPPSELSAQEPSKRMSAWDDFDSIVSTQKPQGTALSAATVEVNRYLDASYLPRTMNPLLWWKENYHLFPTIAKIAKTKLCMVATSVPCERIFSKAGYVVNDRRARLNSKHVERILFVNANSHFL